MLVCVLQSGKVLVSNNNFSVLKTGSSEGSDVLPPEHGVIHSLQFIWLSVECVQMAAENK